MLKRLLTKSLAFLYLIGYKIIKLRNREAVWKLHNSHPLQKVRTILLGNAKTSKKISPSMYQSLVVLFKEIKRNSVILDAGCNTGSISGELIERGNIVYGIDVNPRAVALANYHGLFARVCPVEKLTFEDNFFDYCIAFELLEHLYNPEEGLKELYRVLKPSGKLIGSVPYPGRMFAFSSKYQRIFHQHNFNKENLRELLGKFFKFINIKVEHVGDSPNEVHYRLYFTGVK